MDTLLKLPAQSPLSDSPKLDTERKKRFIGEVTVKISSNKQIGRDGPVDLLYIAYLRGICIIHFLSHGYPPQSIGLLRRQSGAVGYRPYIQKNTIGIILILLVE